jgi:hypothetical protein
LEKLAAELGLPPHDDGDIGGDLKDNLKNGDYAAIKNKLRAEIERSRELLAPRHEQASPMR